jgi:dodecin
MPVMKVIELMGQSTESWEAAAREVITEASETLRGVQSIYIKHFMAEVADGEITNFRVNAKVTFRVDNTSSGAAGGRSTGTGGGGGASKSGGAKSAAKGGRGGAAKSGGRR